MCLAMMMSSCATLGQNYTRVYYDYVVTGVVSAPGFVNDGYYSYHIVGRYPANTYWELWPCDYYIGLYNRSGVFQRWYQPNNWWVFYNGHRHHSYIPKNPPRKPNNMRPPQRPPQRPAVKPGGNGNRRLISPKPNNTRNNNNRGRGRR